MSPSVFYSSPGVVIPPFLYAAVLVLDKALRGEIFS